MLRALLLRIPRFGFVTLFAIMLLFASAAGWLKFHVDLWQEEEALFADLSKAGVDYSYVRHSGEYGNSIAGPAPPQSKLWAPLVPFLSRIDTISFRDKASWELLDRAARLPYVRSVDGGPRGPGGLPPVETIVAKAGFDLDPLATPDVPSELSALPTGEPLDGGAAEALRQKLVASFETKKPPPTRGTLYLAFAAPSAGRGFYARGDDVLLSAGDGAFGFWTTRSSESYAYDGSVARQHSRLDDPTAMTERLASENVVSQVMQSRPDLEYNLESIGIAPKFQETIREPGTIRVERIDDRRVRFDLPPIEADYPKVDCRDVYSISLIARPDLDWELEAFDVVAERETGPNAPATLSPLYGASFRGTLRREQEWIVAEQWVEDTIYLSNRAMRPADEPPFLITSRSVGAARFDLSPDLDLSRLTPDAFDAEKLPPRRELPWLPWHRVTFALSLGLLAFVGVRRFWKRRAEPARLVS